MVPPTGVYPPYAPGLPFPDKHLNSPRTRFRSPAEAACHYGHSPANTAYSTPHSLLLSRLAIAGVAGEDVAYMVAMGALPETLPDTSWSKPFHDTSSRSTSTWRRRSGSMAGTIDYHRWWTAWQIQSWSTAPQTRVHVACVLALSSPDPDPPMPPKHY